VCSEIYSNVREIEREVNVGGATMVLVFRLSAFLSKEGFFSASAVPVRLELDDGVIYLSK